MIPNLNNVLRDVKEIPKHSLEPVVFNLWSADLGQSSFTVKVCKELLRKTNVSLVGINLPSRNLVAPVEN